MGSTHRKQIQGSNEWVDGETNWFRVNVFRSLASNLVSSIHKGDRIIVVGKLNIVSFARKDGSFGTSVEIDAESIGPDLQFGTAFYTRTGSQRPAGELAPLNSQGQSFDTLPHGDGNPFTYDADASQERAFASSQGPGSQEARSEDPSSDDEDSQDSDSQYSDSLDAGLLGAGSEDLNVAEDEDSEGIDGAENVDHATGELMGAGDPY